MPTIHPPRLIKPDVLTEMKRSSVRDLLSPYAFYLEGRGVPFAEITSEDFDLNRLYEVLASPIESTPPELVERLELLDLVGATQSALNFEAEYHEIVQKLRDPSDTPADLAVRIVLHAPNVAWREFDRRVLDAPRTLVSFRVTGDVPIRPVTRERIAEFRERVGNWFIEHARGSSCRVQHHEEPGGIGFVIRHGDFLKRFDVLDEDGNAASRVLRRERVDVAHFREETGEWQISGVGAKVRQLYRESFGQVFHGSATALSPSRRFTLEPLRKGRESLACDPAGPIQHAELKSLKLELFGEPCITLEKRVFDTLDALQVLHEPESRLVSARIDLKLSGRRAAVRLKICPERDTILGATGIPEVEEWLVARGFAIGDDRTLMASA